MASDGINTSDNLAVNPNLGDLSMLYSSHFL